MIGHQGIPLLQLKIETVNCHVVHHVKGQLLVVTGFRHCWIDQYSIQKISYIHLWCLLWVLWQYTMKMCGFDITGQKFFLQRPHVEQVSSQLQMIFTNCFPLIYSPWQIQKHYKVNFHVTLCCCICAVVDDVLVICIIPTLTTDESDLGHFDGDI